MFDYIQVILWSITYVLVLFYRHRYYKVNAVTMPVLSCVLNMSWEIVALCHSRGYWAHIVWLTLDICIFLTSVAFLKEKASKVCYIALLIIITLLLYIVFELPEGMLISCFVIDFLMSIDFFFNRKNLMKQGKTIIAGIKMLGDLAPALHYSPSSVVVFLLSIGVLFLNIQYFTYSLLEKRELKQQT